MELFTAEQVALRNKWTGALRSGNYKQGNGKLRSSYDDQTFCCLGVLCDIINPKGWSTESATPGYMVFRHPTKDGDATMQTNLVPALREHVGITVEEQCNLISWNDTGTSFNEIANAIDKETARGTNG